MQKNSVETFQRKKKRDSYIVKSKKCMKSPKTIFKKKEKKYEISFHAFYEMYIQLNALSMKCVLPIK